MLFLSAGDQGPNNHDSVLTAVITLAGIVITGLVSYLVARQASKQSDKASRRSADVSLKEADVNSWDKLVTSLQNELSRLNARLEGLEKQGDDDRKRIEALEDQVRAGDVKYRVALQYIHDIIEWTKKILGTNELPPAAPPLIASDLEMHGPVG